MLNGGVLQDFANRVIIDIKGQLRFFRFIKGKQTDETVIQTFNFVLQFVEFQAGGAFLPAAPGNYILQVVEKKSQRIFGIMQRGSQDIGKVHFISHDHPRKSARCTSSKAAASP